MPVKQVNFVEYEGVFFLGMVTYVKENCSMKEKYLLKALKSNGFTGKWPEKVDGHDYPMADIKELIKTPQLFPGASRNFASKLV